MPHLIRTLAVCLVLLTCLFSPAPAKSSGSGSPVYVRGYTRADGTYVAPHMRSAPNGTTLDNWSTKGNVNPYTGQPGTKNPNDSLTFTSTGTLTTTTQPVTALTAPDGTQVYAPIASATPTGTSPRAATAPETVTSGDVDARVLAELQSLRAAVQELDARLRALEKAPVRAAAPAALVAWRRLQKGMSKDQVRELLGEPVKASDSQWCYGPESYEHYVLFSSDRVWGWQE